MRRFPSTQAAAVLAIGVVVAGCTALGRGGSGDSSATPGPSASSPSASSGTPYQVDSSPSSLVVRVDSGGGLVPLSFFLDHVPQFSLYGDGRIVVPGPVDSIYPAPLLPNLRVMVVTAAEIQRILAAADSAGLLGADASYTVDGIMDAPTTTFTAIVAGRKHVVSAYALGIEPTASPDPAVASARVRLVDFETKLVALGTFLGREVGTVAYAPTSVRVFTATYDPATDTNGLKRQVLAWPLAIDPGRAGTATSAGTYHCLVLSGGDLATFLGAAASTNGLTVWTAASGSYTSLVRPSLPDETGCGPTAGRAA